MHTQAMEEENNVKVEEKKEVAEEERMEVAESTAQNCVW